MELAFEASRFLSMAAFLFYGVACIAGRSMVAEFERFGLARLRILTGALEVLGALGLAGSYLFPPLGVAAAGGLTLLMFLGVLTRIRVRDTLVSMLPAIALLLVNAFVCASAVRRLSGS